MNIDVANKFWGARACTTIRIFVLLKIIVEHQVLDALLFLPFSLLLVLHSDRKSRVGWQLDSSCLMRD